MPMLIDLTVLSEDELNDLISEASERRNALRESRERESRVGLYGSSGQDVHDPKHGVIPVPTPNEVKAVGPLHGVGDHKPREDHVGQPADHLGASHFEHDALEAAAQAADQGPSFGTPGSPPEPESEDVTDVEQGFQKTESEKGVMRSG
jgi:hypothetical protein